MLSINTHRYVRMLTELLLFALATVAVLAILSVAQAQRKVSAGPTVTPPPDAPPARQALQPAPLFREYRGVALDMPKAEVHQRLGSPTSFDERQDVFNVSDKEMAQVFYGPQGQVVAFTINYLGDPKAPTPQQVFGTPAETRADGSVYKKVVYEAAGMWVAYTSTTEQPPFVTIAVQKLK